MTSSQELKHITLVPALDTPDLEQALRLVGALADHPLVHGFKVGFALGLSHGLRLVVERIRALSDKPVIYDHQKAGTDIPDTGALFADTMRACGVGEVILFPQAGPVTLQAWVRAHQDLGLPLILGALMTHPGYLASEGGFILDSAIPAMYRQAFDLGVRAFVTPLTRPEATRAVLEQAGMLDPAQAGELIFYSPGLGAQGGDPGAFPFLREHRLIAGRALMRAPDPVAWIEQGAARGFRP